MAQCILPATTESDPRRMEAGIVVNCSKVSCLLKHHCNGRLFSFAMDLFCLMMDRLTVMQPIVCQPITYV